MAETTTSKPADKTTQQLAGTDQEQGYFGTLPDPTPNENYTVAGVTSGKPTPETDDTARRKAREALGRV